MRIDAVDLRRIPDPGWLGTGFGITEAFEKRFAVSLGAGFEAVLARGNGKRKRKKFRQQQRHFAERGGYRFLDVPSDQRIATLDVFLEQKKDRFRTLAMPDPFADPGIRAFLIALFLDPAADSRLYVIESGGVTKALLGGIVEDGTFWGMFSSFADDADAGISPGELLLWHMVEALAAEGLAALDLGPGAERYKEAWCDLSVAQYDAITALTLRGRAYVAAAQLKAVARNRVKRSRRLTALAQKLRRRFRGN